MLDVVTGGLERGADDRQSEPQHLHHAVDVHVGRFGLDHADSHSHLDCPGGLLAAPTRARAAGDDERSGRESINATAQALAEVKVRDTTGGRAAGPSRLSHPDARWPADRWMSSWPSLPTAGSRRGHMGVTRRARARRAAPPPTHSGQASTRCSPRTISRPLAGQERAAADLAGRRGGACGKRRSGWRGVPSRPPATAR